MRRIAFGAGILVAGLTVTAWAQGGKNLQHYPKDMSEDDLKAEMKVVARSLGVKCAGCHQMEPRDFSVDTDKKKGARNMLDMCSKLEKEVFTPEWLGMRKIAKPTCFMCHKGHEKPTYKPDKEDDEAKFNAMVESGRKKKTVDAMKRLTFELNKNYFTWKDAPKATCWMCHQGRGHVATKLPKEEDADSDDDKKPDDGKKPDDKKPDDKKDESKEPF